MGPFFLIFEQFFTKKVFDTMVSNTNKYAANKNAGVPQAGQQSRRPWKETSAPEMMIWLGLIIYMSVVRLTRVDEYWTKNGEWLKHCITKFQGFNRFANIKRFFHLFPPVHGSFPTTRFYEKLEPVASMIRTKFQDIAIPASSVSIDEIIVRCTSQSKHTIMMRGKPCPVGYNVLAVCEAGYCYSFLFSSPIMGFFRLPSPAEQVTGARRRNSLDNTITSMITAMSKTSRAVLYLMMQLPHHLFFILYCDNLFSNTDLFHVLRYYGISACGTARSGSKNWPQLFRDKIKRKTTRLPFNFQTAQVIHGDVCAVVWQDKNLVQFLTTHHDPCNSTLVNRKKPLAHNGSKWYKDMVASIWGNQGSTTLPLPTYSVDHNYNMGGVDRHDQMRSYSPTQLISVRNWLPLFFFLLDAAIINAFVISQDLFGHTKIPHLVRQRPFRMRLAWNMIIIGARALDEDWTKILETGQPVQPKYQGKFRAGVTPTGNNTSSRQHGYVGKNYVLPAIRNSPGDHEKVRYQNANAILCTYCRYKRSTLQEAHVIVRRTRFGCQICGSDYPLCDDCFDLWHSTV